MQNNPKVMPTTELEASTRLARENTARLRAQQAAGIERGPPMELDVLRERERVRPKTERYIGEALATSLLDLAAVGPSFDASSRSEYE